MQKSKKDELDYVKEIIRKYDEERIEREDAINEIREIVGTESTTKKQIAKIEAARNKAIEAIETALISGAVKIVDEEGKRDDGKGKKKKSSDW